jgi:2'-5' RNA ligase
MFSGLGSKPARNSPRLPGAVETALEPLGIPRETREFSPHLTLARLETPRVLEAFQDAVKKVGRLAFGRATAEEFHLYQSVLKPGGAEYTRLATFSFAGTIAGRRSE